MRFDLKSALKTAGNFFSTFITAVITIVAILFVVTRLLGWHMFSVDSSSMAPRYPVDTLVVVRGIEPEQIQAGDVITFVLNREGTLVTHRVVHVNDAEQTFTTKGDANSDEDAKPVQWENVVGKVVLALPYLGKPLRTFTAEENRPFVIAALATLFVCSLIWDIVTRKKAHSQSTVSETPSSDGLS